jgi:hypothetical protein
MKHINFPESNAPLGAGDGNENTVPMRVMICEHPEYKSGTIHMAGKFEFEHEEKQFIKELFGIALQKYYATKNPSLSAESIVIDPGALDALIETLPPLWITSMHGWCPLILSIATPQSMGYVKKILPLNPKDN